MKVLIAIDNLDSATGNCIKAVANELTKLGNEVLLLTEKCNNNDVVFCKVEILPTSFGFFKWRKFEYVFKKIKVFLYCVIWPFSSITKPLRLYKKAKQLVLSQKFDIIVASYNGIDDLYVGHKLKNEFNNLLYIPYFLDACYAGQCPRILPMWLKDKMALFWEHHYLKNADGIVMMEAAKTKYLMNKDKIGYFDKITFLDLPLYQPQNSNKSNNRRHFPKEQRVVFYAGSMPRNIRPPHFILDLFSKFGKEDLHLYIAGTTEYKTIIDKVCLTNSNIHFLGALPYNQVKEMMSEADFLLNIGNNLSNMVPSKIFEYMSFGKPIISTYRIDNDPTLTYLYKYKDALLLDERLNLKSGIHKLKDFIFESSHELFHPEDQFVNNRPETMVKYLADFYNLHNFDKD